MRKEEMLKGKSRSPNPKEFTQFCRSQSLAWLEKLSPPEADTEFGLGSKRACPCALSSQGARYEGVPSDPLPRNSRGHWYGCCRHRTCLLSDGSEA